MNDFIAVDLAWQLHSERMHGLEMAAERHRQLADLQRPVPIQSMKPHLQRILTTLYGPNRQPDADPALFSRLAWTGADGE